MEDIEKEQNESINNDTTIDTFKEVNVLPDENTELLDEKEDLQEGNENSPEIQPDTPSEPVQISTEDNNTTNCLALTIQENHKLVAVKNVFLRSIRMSWKVVVSTITLAILKLFS